MAFYNMYSHMTTKNCLQTYTTFKVPLEAYKSNWLPGKVKLQCKKMLWKTSCMH